MKLEANTNLAKVFLAGCLVFNTLDAFLTVIFVYFFEIAGEANPIAGKVLEISPLLFIVFKLFLGALLYFVVRKHLEDKRTQIALAIVFMIYMFIVVCFIWGALSVPFQLLLGGF